MIRTNKTEKGGNTLIDRLVKETRKASRSGSNVISHILRPIFEKQAMRKALGAQLAVLTVATGALGSIPASAWGVVSGESQVEIFENVPSVPMVTNKAVTYPVPEAIGVSQSYHVFHPGIDIRGPLGSPILPIAAGKVKLVDFQRDGYGRRVEILHKDGTESLYAHMGKIFVEEGDEVTTQTKLGEVGLTGKTTGPHLHLEVREGGRAVNPMKYLGR